MDIDDDNSLAKRCFKCDHSLLDNLNIVYNASNTMIIFWNKYQIFVYENFEFESAAKIIVPEFQIHRLIISNNYLVCLDCCGNVHVTTLKFKNAAQKRFKSCFQPREQGIKACIRHDQDHTLSLKLDSDTYFLCLHQINSQFQLENKTILMNNDHWPVQQTTQEESILHSHTVTDEHFKYIKEIFNLKETIRNNYSIVVMSFDKLTIYGCLFSPKMIGGEIMLVKLYTCPAEICSIEIIETGELSIIIALKIGTILRLSLKDLSKKPEIIHLNTALYKLIALKDTLVYTDGVSMWKTENIFSECDIKFTEVFVKHVKDFAKCGDYIVCTTFTNLIYIFSLENEKSYLIPETINEYCSAEKLLNNSEYLYKIFEEIEINNELVKNLNVEGNYITALSLSNRQDIMENVIQTNVIVYESYEDAITENTEMILTENLVEYFDAESFFFLVNITTSTVQHKFSNILSSLFGDLKIHITLSSEYKTLKSTSIKQEEQLKKVNFFLPLKTNLMLDTSTINVNIKIVTNIPGALDHRQTVWTVLYRKDICLNSEHFIKSNQKSKNICLKESNESLEDLILQTTFKQYGGLFKFSDISKHKTNRREWAMYVKLPHNYEVILKTADYYKKHFNTHKTKFLTKHCSSEEFIKSEINISFLIGNEKVNIEIVNDAFSTPLLKVTSENIKIAFDIRNFFSNMIHNDYSNYEAEKEFIPYTFYTITENLQKAVTRCITNSAELEEFLPLVEEFERNIIGALPI